ncbi:hypothetical protein PZA11_005708 [Diplocarpon coronariae]
MLLQAQEEIYRSSWRRRAAAAGLSPVRRGDALRSAPLPCQQLSGNAPPPSLHQAVGVCSGSPPSSPINGPWRLMIACPRRPSHQDVEVGDCVSSPAAPPPRTITSLSARPPTSRTQAEQRPRFLGSEPVSGLPQPGHGRRGDVGDPERSGSARTRQGYRKADAGVEFWCPSPRSYCSRRSVRAYAYDQMPAQLRSNSVPLRSREFPASHR